LTAFQPWPWFVDASTASRSRQAKIADLGVAERSPRRRRSPTARDLGNRPR
jgi:hypothetical protein